MEYEYALACGVPAVAFLLHDDARKTWPSDRVEFAKREKVEEFRKLCQGKMVQFWRNADNLAARASSALSEQFREKPRTGWVRADRMASQAAMVEIAALSEERRALQKRLSELEAQARPAIPDEVSFVLKHLAENAAADFMELDEISAYKGASLLEVFVEASRLLADGGTAHTLGMEFYITFSNPGKRKIMDVVPIIEEFLALNILQSENYTDYHFETPSSRRRYFLSEFGKRVLIFHGASQMQEKTATGADIRASDGKLDRV